MKRSFIPRAYGLVVIALMIGNLPVAQADVVPRNMAQLTNLAPDIIVGHVTGMTDGFVSMQGGDVPYTEITLTVSRAVKGNLQPGTFSFRQYGLLQPRDLGNGYTYLGLTPPGWAKYEKGDEVMLFLYHASPANGLRTTVGLAQGAFKIKDGGIISQAGNANLFRNLSLPPGKSLTAAEQLMLAQKRGPLDAETFIGLVEKAVEGNWFAGAR